MQWTLLFSLVGSFTGSLAEPYPFFQAPLSRNAVTATWNTTSQSCGDNDPRARDEGSKYSVIVVSYNSERYTNLFQDRERLCAFSEEFVLVQVAKPIVRAPLESFSDSPPFFVGHPLGEYNRVRILDLFGSHGRQVSHVEASCVDPSEQTIILVKDETCQLRAKSVSYGMPLACSDDVVSFFPYNGPGPGGEAAPRQPYVPLGPRATFRYIHRSRRGPASSRRLLFNLAISHTTSPRRRRLAQIALDFAQENPDLPLHASGARMNVTEYQSVLLASKFTLCPGGHNPETFRMFEALEAGSIPIISRQDYLYPSYRAPFPCGNGSVPWNTVAASPFAQAASVASWEELPVVLEKLLRLSPEDLDELQADSIRWYEALMERTYKTMLNFGQGFEMWPHDGPIVLEGFVAPSVPYDYTPSYEDEQT